MYGSPPIKSLEKHKWNIRIVRAKINSEKIELEVIMAFDFKKEYKEFYMPKNKPEIVIVPKANYKIEGFFEYVVPPLEGFWWQENTAGVDYTDKTLFNWISVIRLPDFITKENFKWAVETATVALMDTYLEQSGYVNDMNKVRLHHEIYLSDPRKVAPEKCKTVIRHPIKKV